MKLTDRSRATLVGALILLAYSMLTYTISGNQVLGVVTDIISGLSVIGIPVLMFPLLKVEERKSLNYAYLISRFVEGILMILGGLLILDPSLEGYRDKIYSDIHIYFFILGALFFYVLLYRSRAIPYFISIWGLVATLLLFIVTILKLFVSETQVMQLMLIPIITNEIFLAIWLIFKGFKIKLQSH